MARLHVFDASYATRYGEPLRCVLCGERKEHPNHGLPVAERARQALELANQARLNGFAVRRDIADGTLDADVALYDLRARSVLVTDLLRAMPGFGRDGIKARDLLTDLQISHLKKVRELTPTQREDLAERLRRRTGRMAA